MEEPSLSTRYPLDRVARWNSSSEVRTKAQTRRHALPGAGPEDAIAGRSLASVWSAKRRGPARSAASREIATPWPRPEVPWRNELTGIEVENRSRSALFGGMARTAPSGIGKDESGSSSTLVPTDPATPTPTGSGSKPDTPSRVLVPPMH